jgi:hypothetical protein
VNSAGANSAACTQRLNLVRGMISFRRVSGYWTDSESLFFCGILDGGALVGCFIGIDDARHQGVAHHIRAGEMREGNAADVLQHVDRVDQAASLRVETQQGIITAYTSR